MRRGAPAGGPGSLQVRNKGAHYSGSSIFWFLALHPHASPKVPVHVNVGCKRGLWGLGGNATIEQKINFWDAKNITKFFISETKTHENGRDMSEINKTLKF